MKLVSVNTGLPRETAWQGGTVTTGIFKKPLSGRVKVRRLNLDGDRQADLSVHGGPSKTAYAYPSEHYPYWRGEFPDIDLPWGIHVRERQHWTRTRTPAVCVRFRFFHASSTLGTSLPRRRNNWPCHGYYQDEGHDSLGNRFGGG